MTIPGETDWAATFKLYRMVELMTEGGKFPHEWNGDELWVYEPYDERRMRRIVLCIETLVCQHDEYLTDSLGVW